MADFALEARYTASIIDFEREVKRMQTINRRAADRILNDHKDAANKINSTYSGANFGAALKGSLGELKSGMADGATASLGRFGSSLSTLGPIAIGVGAAIGAVTLAIGQALAAGEWADDLADTADKLGVTAEQLQELDYVAHSSGASLDEFRGSIEKGNRALGAFQTRIGDAKVKKGFEALGISREEAAEWDTIADGLPRIAEGIKGVSGAAEQAKIAQVLGLDGMLYALRQGEEYFNSTIATARELGLVMDDEMVKRAADASQEFQGLKNVIDMQLRTAFADLMPVLVQVMNFVVRLAGAIRDAAESFKSLQMRSNITLQSNIAEQRRDVQDREAMSSWDPRRIGLGNSRRRLADLEAEDRRRQAAEASAPPTPAPRGGNGGGGGGGGGGGSRRSGGGGGGSAPRDNTQSSANAVANAERQELAARLALAITIEDQHALRTQILAAEYESQRAQVEAQVAQGQISAAAGAQVLASMETTQSLKVQAEEASTQKALAERLTAETEKGLEAERDILSARNDLLQMSEDTMSAQADITDNLVERQALERQIFESEQRRERESMALDLRIQKLKQDEIDARMAALAQRQGAEAQAFERQQSDERGPQSWGAWVEGFGKATAAGKTFNQQLFDIAGSGIDKLTDGLTDAIMGAGSFSEAIGEMAKSVIGQLIKMAVQFVIFETLGRAFGIPGLGKAAIGITTPKVGKNAMGTNAWEGGLTMVGEKGPELINLNRGAGVIPNSDLRNALRIGGVRAPAASQPIVFHTTVNASDSVLTDTVKGWIVQANASSMQAAKKYQSNETRRGQANTFMGR